MLSQLIYAQESDLIKSLEKKILITKTDTSKVTLFYKLAEAYQGVNPKLFDSYLKKGFDLSNKINFIKGQSDYHYILSFKNLSEGNPKMGLSYAHKGSALSLSINDTTGYLKNMYYESASYFYLGDYNQMKTHVETAISFLKNKSFYTDRGMLYSLMAQYYSRVDLAKAFEYIVLEYDCLKIKNDPKQMFSVYNEFAGYYFNVADIKESIKYSKRALAEANKIHPNSDFNRAHAMSNLANVLLSDKQFELAKMYANKSLRLSEKIQNPNLIKKNYILLAEINLVEQNYDTTIKFCNEVLANNELIEYYLDANLYIASAYNGLKKYQEALKVLNSIDKSKMEGYSPANKMSYYQELSISNSALGNYKVAFDNLKIFSELQQIFLEDKGSMHTIGLQSKFQLREKNYAIDKLTLEKQKVEAQNQKQKAHKNLFLGGFVLLIILVMILIWAYQFRKRGNFIFGLSRVQLQNSIQEKEVLVKEIHHRVKNNFQLITSMMHIQAMDKSIDVDEFVKLTTSRIVTLSNIHEKLYMKDNLYQLDAIEYVKEMAEYVKLSFLDSKTLVEYQFSDDIVILDLETIMPLGLIINELLTNTYKYAFKDRIKGVIEIKLNRISMTNYKLLYTDNGVGIDSSKFSKSVGMNLIDALCKQLHTKPKMNFENGASFEIIFKKDN
jgi:two-component sensor histidine kinase